MDVSKLRLPWAVEWRDDSGQPGRKMANLDLGVELADGYRVNSVSLITDVYGDGSSTLGIEYSISSPEEHSVPGDDSLSLWEEEQTNFILCENPWLDEDFGEWDRERGEEEWWSKLVLTAK